MNKIGGEQVLSLYWFALIMLVTGVVVYMVAVFYGSPFDAREVEVNSLINSFGDCLARGGYLNFPVSQISNDNLLELCKITFKTEEVYGWDNDQYYVEIKFEDFETARELSFLNVGSDRTIDLCNKGSKAPVCKNKYFYVLDNQENKYLIKIFALVRKTEKNAV